MMNKTGNEMIKFENGKFVGYVDGKVVVRSTSEYYVKRKISEVSTSPSFKTTESEFGINTRFSFLEQMVSMVADGTTASCVITGEGGLGKSYTVIKALENNGLKNITDLADFQVGTLLNLKKSYRIIKGFSTAKGLYRTLFESNGMTIVFDDCDSILKDDVARNLLKGALDSYSKRYISWMADMRDEDLPKTFEFTGRVIFVSNMPLEKIDQAIRTRCMVVDLSMSELQKIERMEVIAKSEEFLPEVSTESKERALAFLKSHIGNIPNMSLRSLIQVSKIANRGGDWQDLAKYVLTQGA
jgi:hypothetical protein